VEEVPGGAGRAYVGKATLPLPPLEENFMDFGHSSRFATRLAREAAGDLYPGPVLMPRGLLRALDPVLAVAFGPAKEGGSEFTASFEAMLRGRPDGPLLLALWSSAAAGEIPHADLRALLEHPAGPLPDRPASRGELLSWMHPRVSAIARCGLALAQRTEDEALAPAERLGLGFVLTRMLTDLPRHVAAKKFPFPVEELDKVGATVEEFLDGIPTPPIREFLNGQAAWASDLITQGLPITDKVGARLSRGLRAAALRSRKLLTKISSPRRDPFRDPPRLSPRERWECAVRAWWPVAPGPR